MKRSIAIAMMISLTLTACQSGPFKRSGNTGGDDAFTQELLTPVGLLRATAQRFPDVPLPMDAKENPQRTYIYESGSIQIARMVFEVKESVNDVAQFYIRECPNIGWTMDSALQADGITLDFSRPGKHLRVSVTPTGIADRNALLILNYTPDEQSNVLNSNSIQTSPL